MKLGKIISVGIAAILLLQAKSFCQSTNLPPPPAGFASRLDYLKSFTNENDAISAYRKGLISKNEALWTDLLIGNVKSQDFYGKVIDQDGQPVIGANVNGYLRSDEGFGINDEEVEGFKTQTDAEGLFQFTGLHGARFGQKVGKDGYEMRDEGYISQAGSKTSPNDRATFMMWKLRGAEPMRHSQLHAYIPCDGSVTKFDLLTGKKNPDGDLIVNLTRNPLNIDRRRPFNWSVTLEIPNGGVQEISNIYPNEAPAEGYQPTMTLDFPTNKAGWQPEFQHAYYFKSKDGQVYGRMTINIMANFQPPPTLFDVEIYANPAGSQNLEFDWKKQIR
jgi:hypothetical protein